MARQSLAGNGQLPRQHDADAERANARGYRADDRKFAGPVEIGRRKDERRAPAALLAADARIEVAPDQVTRLRHVGHRAHSTISRPLSPPQSKASRIASDVTPCKSSASRQRGRVGEMTMRTPPVSTSTGAPAHKPARLALCFGRRNPSLFLDAVMPLSFMPPKGTMPIKSPGDYPRRTYSSLTSGDPADAPELSSRWT